MSAGIALGTVLQDTYRILRRVGEGGMGEVYEATHARLPGRYAIKVLQRDVAGNPEAFARFRREAEITSALRHPNIVQVMDFHYTADGAPYLVMEFLEGSDLGTRLAERGPLSLWRTASVVEQIASALAAAHAKGIVHRDLKPPNVFLVPMVGRRADLVKVVDFGISKVRSATTSLTRDSAVLGTPQYMSPEQARGRGDEVDGRTDQFALAAMAYEMLTAREAFTGENVPAILYQVVHEDPPPLAVAEVPEEVEAIIFKGLAKKPEARFESVLEMADALAAAAGRAPRRSAAAPAEAAAAPGPVARAEAQARDGGVAKPDTGAPTTVEAAASQAHARGGGKRRSAMWWGGLGGGTLVLGLLALALLRPGPAAPPARREGSLGTIPRPVAPRSAAPRSAAPTPVATPATAPPSAVPDEVEIAVSGAPPGLRVTVDGKPASPPIRLPRGAEQHVLVFSAAGYQKRTVVVDGSRDDEIVPNLKRARPRPSGLTRRPAPPPKPR